jgi:hypothetical protein
VIFIQGFSYKAKGKQKSSDKVLCLYTFDLLEDSLLGDGHAGKNSFGALHDSPHGRYRKFGAISSGLGMARGRFFQG